MSGKEHASSSGVGIRECAACGSSKVRIEHVVNVSKAFRGRELDFTICTECNLAFAPSNTHDYAASSDFGPTSSTAARRVGDGEQPGREFFMFKTASKVLRPAPASLDVLFFGSGLSRDHVLAGAEPETRRSSIADLHNFQNTDAFVPIGADQQFDIVVACEVVEHFEDPARGFASIFRFLKPGGLAICSTNIRDMTRLEKLAYPFYRGHVAYYSGDSLIAIGKRFGMTTDFRVPECALADRGPRKRYIFFHKAPEVQEGIARFFADHVYAYSEPPPKGRLRQAGRAEVEKGLTKRFS